MDVRYRMNYQAVIDKNIFPEINVRWKLGCFLLYFQTQFCIGYVKLLIVLEKNEFIAYLKREFSRFRN